jgi:homoserine kinase type II
MSVYTPLSLDEVRTFAAPYGLEVLELNPIQEVFKTPIIFWLM